MESTEPVCALLRRNSRRKRTSGRRSGWSLRKREGSGRKRGSERGSDATVRGRRSAKESVRGSGSESETKTAEPEIERETGSGTGSQTEARSTAAPSVADPGEHTGTNMTSKYPTATPHLHSKITLLKGQYHGFDQ